MQTSFCLYAELRTCLETDVRMRSQMVDDFLRQFAAAPTNGRSGDGIRQPEFQPSETLTPYSETHRGDE
jgi:hypothetical protein